MTELTFEVYAGDQLVRTETLHSAIIKIGKLPSSHLRLEGDRVSRMHAVVEVAHDGVTIIDLGSNAGTLLNGQKVARSKLLDGDTLMLGDVKMVVRITEVAAPEAAQPKVPAALDLDAIWRMQILTHDTDLPTLRAVFEHDPYLAGAARTLGKPCVEVTKDERDAYKHAFFSTYRVRGPHMIKNDLMFLGRVWDELTRRGIAEEIDAAIRWDEEIDAAIQRVEGKDAAR